MQHQRAFEDKMISLLEANLKAQENNLVAINENRKAIIEIKKVLIDMNDKLRKISLNY
jgi:hypothetical protein